jgi:hypothetical protein
LKADAELETVDPVSLTEERKEAKKVEGEKNHCLV